jgi:hypothetical protein
MAPKCTVVFSRRFLAQNFTQVFLNTDYKNIIANAKYSEEKSRLSESMTEASLIKYTRDLSEKVHRLTQEYSTSLQAQLSALGDRFPHHNTRSREENEAYQREYMNIELKHAPIKYDIDMCRRLLNEAQNDLNMLKYGEIRGRKKIDGDAVVTRCPVVECTGYVTARAWRCGMCNVKVCAQCHKSKSMANDVEHVDENHQCDRNEVETVKMLNKDSKPCPKCNMPIMKAYGCNQMWATCCNIAFNWATGEIVRDRRSFHNPEYTAYLLKQGKRRDNDMYNRTENATGEHLETVRMADDVDDNNERRIPPLIDTGVGGCAQMPSIDQLIMSMERFGGYDRKAIVQTIEFFRLILDLRDKHLGRDPQTDNHDLRVKRLLNDIDDETFKNSIYRRSHDVQKISEIRETQEFFRLGTTEICRRLVDTKGKRDAYRRNAIACIEELIAFMRDVEEAYKIVLKIYNCKIKFFDIDEIVDVANNSKIELEGGVPPATDQAKPPTRTRRARRNSDA